MLPSTINNLTVDNTSILTLSQPTTCNDLTTTTNAQLIIPAGIGLTTNGAASFAIGKPLIIETTSTDFVLKWALLLAEAL